MFDSTQEAKELLARWIEQKAPIDFLIRRLELNTEGIIGGEARGTGSIIELRESILRIERQDGEEVRISINGAFIVEYSPDHTFVIVRNPDSRVSVEFRPHSYVTES